MDWNKLSEQLRKAFCDIRVSPYTHELTCYGPLADVIAAAICARQEQRAEPCPHCVVGNADMLACTCPPKRAEPSQLTPDDRIGWCPHCDGNADMLACVCPSQPQPSGDDNERLLATWKQRSRAPAFTVTDMVEAGDALAARVEELGRAKAGAVARAETAELELFESRKEVLRQQERATAAERKLTELSARPHPDRAAIESEQAQRIAFLEAAVATAVEQADNALTKLASVLAVKGSSAGSRCDE